MRKDNHVHVAFVGNPNCGKTTLFNAITGSKLKVANWPGVTVEKYEGNLQYEGYELKLVDTPGIYSLTSYTIEEKVTRRCVLDDDIEVIVNVVDASCLERNLYLTLQLLELGKPVILALNMMDIVKERGMEIDLHRLPEMLGDIPVVPVSAARRTGLDILMHAVVHHYEEGPKKDILDYGEEVEEKLSELEERMQSCYPNHSSIRWHAIKLLEDDEEVKKDHPLEVDALAEHSYEKVIARKKYEYIEKIMEEVLFYKDRKAASTDRIDKIMTHPVWGVPVFLCIMALVFFLTFFVGGFSEGRTGIRACRFFGFCEDRSGRASRDRMDDFPCGGWGNCRCGRYPDLYPQHIHPVSGACHSGGQWLHGQGGLCYGRDYGKGGAVRQGVSSHGAGLRLYGSGDHGDKGAGNGA